MDTRKRTSLVGGIILIVLGVLFAVTQIFHVESGQFWPFYIIGAGVLLFVLGAFLGAPDMAIPACIVAGIGGILYWQASQAAANPQIYASWAYTWALIPGFVGIGMALAALMGAHKRYSIYEIINTILTSLVLFLIFFAIFAPMFGQLPAFLEKFWPLLLAVAGVIILIRGFLRPRKEIKSTTAVKVVTPVVPPAPPALEPAPTQETAPVSKPEVISEAIKEPVKKAAKTINKAASKTSKKGKK